MELLRYKVCNCGLAHEAFIPAGSEQEGQQHAWERRGFCPLAVRNSRISCAHSMAWYGFLRELQQDPEKYQSDRVQLLLGSMEALRTQIFKLDHQKSDLEAGKKNDIDNRSIHQNLQRLSENYDKVIDEMKALYQKINQEYQDQG